MFQDRPSKISHETWYSTGDWQAGQQAIRFAVSAESRNLIIAAWNDSGVGKGGTSFRRNCTRGRRPRLSSRKSLAIGPEFFSPIAHTVNLIRSEVPKVELVKSEIENANENRSEERR